MGGDLGRKDLSNSGCHILIVVWPGPLSMPEENPVNYLDESSVIASFLNWGRRRQKNHSQRDGSVKDLTNLDLLALKMEEGAANPGMQVASKNWKGPGSRLPTRAPERHAALLTP